MAEGSPTVFIVDDDAAVRASLEMLVRSAGWRSETFASGDEFLEAFSRGSTGCVLLDLRMPGMSGLEVHDQLAAMGSKIPVIFLTAQAEEETPEASGQAARLQKPFRSEELIDELRRLFKGGSSDDR